jgi:anti-anti-sigma regulatory factor
MGKRPHVLILRMRQFSYLDVEKASVLVTLLQECRVQNIHFILSALPLQPRKNLGRVG